MCIRAPIYLVRHSELQSRREIPPKIFGLLPGLDSSLQKSVALIRAPEPSPTVLVLDGGGYVTTEELCGLMSESSTVNAVYKNGIMLTVRVSLNPSCSGED